MLLADLAAAASHPKRRGVISLLESIFHGLPGSVRSSGERRVRLDR